jgi:hypothetical protein
MNSKTDTRASHRTTMLLFVGFSGVTGWIAATAWLLWGWTNSGHWATWTSTFRTVGIFGLWCSFFLIFALVGLPWGFRLLRRREHRGKVVARALVPAVILTPVYAFVGAAVVLLAPFISSMAYAVGGGPNVIESVMSPDGNYEAYVVDQPCIDPPNQVLYLQRSDDIHYVYVANLAADVDSIREILWSPHNDIVVFHTRFHLFAVRVPGYQTVKIGTGREWTRSQPGKRSTFTSGPHLQVAEIGFPGPGTFSYRLEGAAESHMVDMDAIVPGESSFLQDNRAK